MSAVIEHGLQMRAPWYVLERGGLDRFAPEAPAPAIQKYIADDFADLILEDPRDSYKMTEADGDFWSYPVQLGPDPARKGRAALSSHAMVASGLRKLYQPHHGRFYAVTVEVFCDRAGLPRPGPDDELELSLVLRRIKVEFPDAVDVRRRAHQLAQMLYLHRHTGLPGIRVGRDAGDLMSAHLGSALIDPDRDEGQAKATEQFWKPGTGWEPVVVTDPPEPADGEVETRMWRVPTAPGCPRRSLWFGLVPTFSGKHDANGQPKLDETAIYHLRCVARRVARPGHEHCPRPVHVSAPTEPYRLAAFADPEGTAKKRTSITMPDLRAVAARAGQPAGMGGVAITTPPGSRFSFNPNNGNPKEPAPVTGTAAQTCTYALEIFMIVAMFVFALFLPIVVFLFQLWWLLALRFCLPPQAAALQVLSAHFVTDGKAMKDMTATQLTAFDRVVGAAGAGQRLKDAPPQLPSGAADPGADLVAALAPPPTGAGTGPEPESKPDDPLCPR